MEDICEGPCRRGIEKWHAQNNQMTNGDEQYIRKPRPLALKPGLVRVIDAETSLSFHFGCKLRSAEIKIFNLHLFSLTQTAT